MSQKAPFFSVITPVYDPPLDVLEQTIAAVRRQRFEDWELILVDDCSPSEAVRTVLRRAARTDRRIRVIERETNGGIAAASNDALAAARGQFVALLDHDDLITAFALEAMAGAIEANPLVDYLYSDEDKIDPNGRHFHRFLKPVWSPERLRCQMYTAHFSVIRMSVLNEVGLFDPSYDGSQDYDLVLRVTERARQVVHVPQVLYHWRVLPGSAATAVSEKPAAWEAGRRAVQAHLDRLHLAARAELGMVPGTHEIIREIPPDLRVSLVIPTRGTVGLVWGEQRCFVLDAVRSALARTNHRDVEVVVVYDEVTPASVLAELREIVPGDRLVLVPFFGSFNFSRKCNVGVLASHGDVVILLNDDVSVRKPRWIENLVGPLLEPDVGMTGARLLFSDGTVQHGGHEYSRHGYHHIYYGEAYEDPGKFSALVINRECSGVTAACAALRRSVFDEVGGLCGRLPANFNDVDFSLKLGAAGYRVVYVANVELYHFESKSRDPKVEAWEVEVVRSRWDAGEREFDPYLPDWNPFAFEI